MQNYTVLIATENASLAQYTGRKYPKGMNPVSFEELAKVSKNTTKALSALVKVLSGSEPDPESQAMVVGTQSGAFKRFYGPELAAQDDQLGIAFGSVFYPMPTDKGAFAGELPEGVSIKLGFQVAKLNGFDELTFKVSILLEATDTLLGFNLPIRWEDYKATKPDIEVLNTLFERKPKEVVQLLDAPYDGSGSFDGPTLKLGQLMIGEVYTVVGYRAVNTSNGPSFMIQIAGQVDEAGEPIQDYLSAANEEDKGNQEPLLQAEVWSNGPLKTFLSSGPEINEESPAEIHIRSKKKTKTGNISVDAAIIFDAPDVHEVEEDELDFNF
jgi:hypothetical protein